jgi:rfaE bifunctional protein kinase chain/domain
MTVDQILRELPKKTALVVGDVSLDRWCTYDPAEGDTSRETGLQRIAVVSVELSPGAAGTVANNLAALGVGRVAVLGPVGIDGHGHELIDCLSQRNISPELLIRNGAIRTFTYTKLINSYTGLEDKPRLDFINNRQLPASVEREMLQHLREFAGAFDVIFVSDQAETKRGGAVTAPVRAVLAELAEANPEKVCLVDSRLRAELFRRVIVKGNQSEMEQASLSQFGDVDFSKLRQKLSAPYLFVTLGKKGTLVIGPDGEEMVSTRGVEHPVDICGAGDSFSAGAGVALAITGSALEAARFGNLVASITVMKKGTGTASPEELLAAL